MPRTDLDPQLPARLTRRSRISRDFTATWLAEPATHVRQLWAAECVGLVTGLVQIAVLARILGIEQLGKASVVVAVPSLAFALIDPQSQSVVTQALARHHASGDGRRAAAAARLGYAADGVLALSGTVLLLPFAALIADRVLRDGTMSALVAVAVLGAATASSVLTSKAILGALDAFASVRRVTVYVSLARCACLCIAAILWGVAGYVVAFALSQLAEAVVYLAVSTRAHGRAVAVRIRDARTTFLGTERRQLIRFMSYTNVTTFLNALSKEADLVLVGALAGPLQAGQLRIARSVALGIGRAVAPLQAVAVTRLSRTAAHGGIAAIREQCRRYLVRVGLPVALAGLAALPVIPALLPLLAGTHESGALGPSLWLTGGALVSIAFFWVVPSLIAVDRPRLLLVLSGTTSILCFVGYLVVAKRFGASGVAAVRALVAGLGANLTVLLLMNHFAPPESSAPGPVERQAA